MMSNIERTKMENQTREAVIYANDKPFATFTINDNAGSYSYIEPCSFNKEIEELKSTVSQLLKSKEVKVVKNNCPNCGAPITGKRCEYCDTWFVDPVEEEKRKLEELEKLKRELEQSKASIAIQMQSNYILSALHPFNTQCSIQQGYQNSLSCMNQHIY